MKPTNEDIRNRYMHHNPPHQMVVDAHQAVRETLAAAAVELNELLPDSRYTELFHIALEQARVWANTAIAVDGVDPEWALRAKG